MTQRDAFLLFVSLSNERIKELEEENDRLQMELNDSERVRQELREELEKLRSIISTSKYKVLFCFPFFLINFFPVSKKKTVKIPFLCPNFD